LREPVAVIAGDIHYSLSTLQCADSATRQAISKANQLNVPFIANGDTHNDKALLRAECTNAMIETFKIARVTPIVNIGNHCRINEKSEAHALNFLAPYAHIVDRPTYFKNIGAYVIPYNHDKDTLRNYIKHLPKGSILIMHQGVNGSDSGEYFQDKSALDAKDLDGYRVILSHYHVRQDINCGSTTATYIGNPYTLNFAEAKDPAKGFQVLYDDGSLEFIPTNLRKHRVYESSISDIQTLDSLGKDDILWVKITGPSDILAKVKKEDIAKYCGISGSFKLDLIPDDTTSVKEAARDLPQDQLLDSLIDGLSNTTQDRKDRLKDLWKQLIKE
jgi:hypothetical protein